MKSLRIGVFYEESGDESEEAMVSITYRKKKQKTDVLKEHNFKATVTVRNRIKHCQFTDTVSNNGSKRGSFDFHSDGNVEVVN